MVILERPFPPAVGTSDNSSSPSRQDSPPASLSHGLSVVLHSAPARLESDQYHLIDASTYSSNGYILLRRSLTSFLGFRFFFLFCSFFFNPLIFFELTKSC